MIGQQVFVWLLGQLVCMNGDVYPVGTVYRHEVAGKWFLLLHDCCLQFSVMGHCLEIDTVSHTVDGMHNWVYFLE